MLLAHKIEVRPTADQADYLNRAGGARRHCYNQLLDHFKQATLSTGEEIPANQKLKANLKRLRRKSRNLSRKQAGSKRRAKAELQLARLHLRVANQRHAVIHEVSDTLTRTFKTVVLEDLNGKGMAKNRKLARAVNDAGFGMLRQAIEYKAALRGVQVIVADRWFPSTRTCNACGQLHDMPLGKDTIKCDCGNIDGRDLNAAKNLEKYGRLTLLGDLKRTQESNKTASVASAVTA